MRRPVGALFGCDLSQPSVRRAQRVHVAVSREPDFGPVVQPRAAHGHVPHGGAREHRDLLPASERRNLREIPCVSRTEWLSGLPHRWLNASGSRVVVEILQFMLLALVALSLLGTLFSHAFAWYYFASYDRRFPRREYAPPVSVIKPVKGVDQSALANFRGFCEQDYPSDYEVVFCVEGRDDPSVLVIERIIEEYPDRDVRLIFSDPEDARSVGKLKNMIAGYAHSSYDVIVFSDSDAQVPPNFLKETVACLEIPEVGLGFGAPAYVGARDWAAALMAFSANPFVLRLASMCLFRAFVLLGARRASLMMSMTPPISGPPGRSWRGRAAASSISPPCSPSSAVHASPPTAPRRPASRGIRSASRAR